MIPNSDASLKGKVKALAKKHGLRPQEILQMYLFERLLKRLEQSRYADKFILKGGLLIASLTGISQRTTMDMDATVIGMSMKQGAVEQAIRTICSTPVDDGMLYEFEYLEPIRKDIEYANCVPIYESSTAKSMHPSRWTSQPETESRHLR